MRAIQLIKRIFKKENKLKKHEKLRIKIKNGKFIDCIYPTRVLIDGFLFIQACKQVSRYAIKLNGCGKIIYK